MQKKSSTAAVVTWSQNQEWNFPICEEETRNSAAEETESLTKLLQRDLRMWLMDMDTDSDRYSSSYPSYDYNNSVQIFWATENEGDLYNQLNKKA